MRTKGGDHKTKSYCKPRWGFDQVAETCTLSQTKQQGLRHRRPLSSATKRSPDHVVTRIIGFLFSISSCVRRRMRTQNEWRWWLYRNFISTTCERRKAANADIRIMESEIDHQLTFCSLSKRKREVDRRST